MSARPSEPSEADILAARNTYVRVLIQRSSEGAPPPRAQLDAIRAVVKAERKATTERAA